MRVTDHTLMEQLQIIRREIDRRKEFFNITTEDVRWLENLKGIMSHSY